MPPGQADLLNLFKGYFMRSVITLRPSFYNSYPGVGKSDHEQDGLGPGVAGCVHFLDKCKKEAKRRNDQSSDLAKE